MNKFERACPECGEIITYSCNYQYTQGTKLNKLCKPCSSLKNLKKVDHANRAALSKEQQEELCSLYVGGQKTKELAEKYSLDQLTIQRYLHRNKIPLRPFSQETRKWATDEERNEYYRSRRYYNDWKIKFSESYERNKERKRLNLKEGRIINNCKRRNITYEEFMKVLDAQGYLCPVCGKSLEFTSRYPHIDHDHKTGKVRGILHNKCNVLLGFAEENIDILLGAIEYLNPNFSH